MISFIFNPVVSLLIVASHISGSASLTPVVILPGDGGCQLEAKLDKPQTVHFFCSKKSDWFTLWLSVAQLAPKEVDCWSDNIRLVYDESTESFSNSPGVQTRVPGYGDTKTIENLDPTLKSSSSYFAPLVQALADKGYVRNSSVFGAPYDFRLGPPSNMEYMVKTVQLIEHAYSLNGNSPVVLVSHSMGCLWTLFILNHQPQEWKDKFIAAWVPFSGVFGGSTNEMELMASGSNEGIPWLSGIDVRAEQRSYESNFWLMPNPELWSPDEPLVITPSKNYSAHDYSVFFKDVGYPLGDSIYKRVDNLTRAIEAPGVAVHALYGTDVDTPVAYIYKEDGKWDVTPTKLNGKGDGTVPLRSLEACLKWKHEQPQVVTSKTFAGVDHTDLVSNKGAIDALLSILKDTSDRIIV
ncbi:hypothetical protein CYMTET_43324 [Cymbomonas tetramitiformis]|uniref:Uncharacterized protein n=1 Tax=Cymbomonas tetramitiformis TaxID=36881 RepID=A0AAE0C3G5_9CHLO|nr:hypothetical protein CYMTET_43324 [Cymbomonas tetramitiformis]